MGQCFLTTPTQTTDCANIHNLITGTLTIPAWQDSKDVSGWVDYIIPELKGKKFFQIGYPLVATSMHSPPNDLHVGSSNNMYHDVILFLSYLHNRLGQCTGMCEYNDHMTHRDVIGSYCRTCNTLGGTCVFPLTDLKFLPEAGIIRVKKRNSVKNGTYPGFVFFNPSYSSDERYYGVNKSISLPFIAC